MEFPDLGRRHVNVIISRKEIFRADETISVRHDFKYAMGFRPAVELPEFLAHLFIFVKAIILMFVTILMFISILAFTVVLTLVSVLAFAVVLTLVSVLAFAVVLALVSVLAFTVVLVLVSALALAVVLTFISVLALARFVMSEISPGAGIIIVSPGGASPAAALVSGITVFGCLCSLELCF